MKKISKLLVGFSFALPVLFLLLSKPGNADTMDKMKALENAEIDTLAGGCFWCKES
ncbi:methionine sulfoxide reductase, partial [Vibrio sp. 665]|nr:methionine sulfoxide reductase [Vibrio sp. 665]